MMRARAALAATLLALAAPAASASDYLVADLSEHRISITSGFTGADVLLFGTRGGQGDVVVVLRGPATPVVVRRKDRVFGLWLNRARVTFTDAPGYYAVAASRPLDEIAAPELLAEHEIGFERLRLSATAAGPDADLPTFREALLRNMERARLYHAAVTEVAFVGDLLFRTTFDFPANVPTGFYRADVYLFDRGELVSERTNKLVISKIGFEAALSGFASSQPLGYGLVAVLLALMAGWSVGVIFRKS
jgi:uncharacterized protein (TIGR02186 family)